MELVKRAAQLEQSPTILYLGAHVQAVAGQKDEARKLIKEGEEATQTPLLLSLRNRLRVCEPSNFDSAHKWFRKGVEDRADCMAWLGVEPWMEPFRSDPRYATLLQEVGIDPQARAGQAR
jgi:hypothetical protein